MMTCNEYKDRDKDRGIHMMHGKMDNTEKRREKMVFIDMVMNGEENGDNSVAMKIMDMKKIIAILTIQAMMMTMMI